METPCKTEDDCPTPTWCRGKNRCPKRDAEEKTDARLAGTPCSRLVLQRRYLPSHGTPKSWTEWHDHPEPHQIAWGPGQCASLEENMRRACRNYYEFGKGIEYRMVHRIDETVWEYSANANVDSTAEAP